jgi:tetratricopeptide (TPR) repeat protein
LSKIGKGEEAVDFALEYCAREYELNPGSDMAARILFESGGQWKAEDAIMFAEKWLSRRSGEVGACFLSCMGDLYWTLGNHEKHEECLCKALELDGNTSSYAIGVINILLDQGRDEEAAAFGEEWLSKQSREINDYSDEGFWNGLGMAYDRLGAYDRAEECFRASYQILPVNSMHTGNRAGALMNALFEQAKNEEALAFGMECCRKADELSLSAITACDIMSALHERGKNGEAIIFGGKWLAQNSESESAGFWAVLGLAHGDSGDYVKSEEYCRKAHYLDPANSFFAGHVVKAMRGQGKNEAATAFGREWLSKVSGETCRYFWGELGSAYESLGDVLNHEECLRKAKECEF